MYTIHIHICASLYTYVYIYVYKVYTVHTCIISTCKYIATSKKKLKDAPGWYNCSNPRPLSYQTPPLYGRFIPYIHHWQVFHMNVMGPTL